jgi:hypothetical protein
MIYATCRTFIVGMTISALAAIGMPGRAQAPASAESTAEILKLDQYHTLQELNAAIIAINRANPDLTTIHRIGRSPGGRELLVLEVDPNASKTPHRVPAVFVVGNLEGTVPIASEAALFLAYQLTENAETRKNLAWYILVAGNPDGAARFFTRPLFEAGWNDRTHNDDLDDAVDEDGPDDLDGDGIITQMRVKDPGGDWIPAETDPRLMRRADPTKGEQGIYKIYSEGIDQDADGEYNEDGPGGTDISITFPHLFRPFTAKGGDWPGSEPETFAIMKFVMDHPEIAMTFTLGSTNMCLQPPAGGRKGAVDLTRIKVPERYAKSFGADPNATYSLQEIMDMIRPMVPPGTEITEAMVSSILGLGAVVNPLEEDLKFYRELSERYKEFLNKNKLDSKRLNPLQPKDASFELWSYYQLGVPTFSMDLWTLPEVEDEMPGKSGITAGMLEGMSGDAFAALGEQKIALFLKEAGAPDTVKPATLIEQVKNGKMTPKQISDMMKQTPKPKASAGDDPKMKALLAFSDKVLGGKGFVAWAPFKHPTLGDVEIGGAVPYVDSTPPPSMIKELVEGQVPWVFDLAAKLPRVRILKTDVAAKGASVYELTVWVHNAGELPLPTAMGRRNRHVGPIVLTVDGGDLQFLSGRKRTALNEIDAMKSRKLIWLVQSEKPQTLRLTLESANAGSDSAEVRLGGAQ